MKQLGADTAVLDSTLARRNGRWSTARVKDLRGGCRTLDAVANSQWMDEKVYGWVCIYIRECLSLSTFKVSVVEVREPRVMAQCPTTASEVRPVFPGRDTVSRSANGRELLRETFSW